MGEPRHCAGTDATAGVWDIALIERRCPPMLRTPSPAMTQDQIRDRINPPPHSVAIGIACGVGAAVFWAAGFVAARHGIDIGFSPFDIALHRFVWSAPLLIPLF